MKLSLRGFSLAGGGGRGGDSGSLTVVVIAVPPPPLRPPPPPQPPLFLSSPYNSLPHPGSPRCGCAGNNRSEVPVKLPLPSPHHSGKQFTVYTADTTDLSHDLESIGKTK